MEKELTFGDHGYARRVPLPGLDSKEGERAAEEQQPCTQCQLLKKQLEKELQHTARLQKEVSCRLARLVPALWLQSSVLSFSVRRRR